MGHALHVAEKSPSRSPSRTVSHAPMVMRQATFGNDYILQPKTDRCACGGSCPRCQEQFPLQKKLAISEPGDPYEQEADRIADEVMWMPAHPAANGVPPRIQRFAGPPTGLTDATPASVDHALAGPERALEPVLRHDMEQRFGHDFSRVRVHSGAIAEQSARDMNARAYTVGNDLVFAAGEFAPGTRRGQRLIAHELAHVIQVEDSRLAPSVIARMPHESGIEDERFSYSTNCGWIDWGHSNPANARNLIAVVREASQRMARKESAVAASNASTPPALLLESECPYRYDETEADESINETVTVGTQARASGVIEVQFDSFGVDSADVAKAADAVDQLAEYIDSMQYSTGTRFDVVVSGFSDCIGGEQRNVALRQKRRDAITALLFVKMAGRGLVPTSGIASESYGPDQYLASNASRPGRRANRGVLVRLLPQAGPEQIRPIPPVEARPVDRVTTEAMLNRSLSENEVLSVALGIFVIESHVYEVQQAWSQIPFLSSFSEEDLPSNQIGFYRAARGYSSPDIRALCDVWDVPRSLTMFQGYQFATNPTFQPLHLPPGGQWPAEFQTIQPAAPATDLFNIMVLLVENPFLTARCQWVSGRLQCP